MRAAVLAALGAAAAVSCARPFAPPGGERDTVAPRLTATTPEPLAVIAPGNTPAVFRFDERLSERGFSEALITVSPLDSTLRVDRSGAEVRVRIDGGWRANRVYRVVILPGLRDLFGNERRDQVELVFSTGAEVGSTALAGMVLDRVTGAPARAGFVEALHRAESARYIAIADSTGFYSLRYLPPGEYDVLAFDDQNRNRRRDLLEPVDSGQSAIFATPTDTVALVFRVLSPDTSGPRVVRAASIDSLHVRVELDDAVDAPEAISDARAEVHLMPDSTRYAGGIRIVAGPVFTAERAAAADSVAAAPRAQGPVPPVRQLVVQLDRPLVPGIYTITLVGVVNLHGLTGGGSARFTVSAPVPPPPPDTTVLRRPR